MQIIGTGANDALTDAASADEDDTLLGLAGDDRLDSGAGTDLLDGGTGYDIASFARRRLPVHVDLTAGLDLISGSGLIGIEAVIGTRFDDTLIGDGADNQLRGGAGDDSLLGGGGNDTIRGGKGDDVIDGGSGFDVARFSNVAGGLVADLSAGVATGRGNDTLIGIEGLVGTSFDDSLTGDDGNNRLNAGRAGADTLIGGLGFDIASFNRRTAAISIDLATGEETSSGSTLAGIEAVIGSRFGDAIRGDAGDNVLRGKAGADSIEGGSGNDTVLGGRGDDSLDGGDGFDILSFIDARAGVEANLASGAARGQGRDSLSGFEGLVGTPFADRLSGDDGANWLSGGTGGADTLAGGAGYDTASFADRDGPVEADLLAGTEIRSGSALIGIEALVGSAFGDTLTGDAGDNVLNGWRGGDLLIGGEGNDTLIGGAGNDTLDGGDGFDLAAYADAGGGVVIDLGAGTATGQGSDRLVGLEGAVGSAFADAITGDAGDNWLNGGTGGADTLVGGGGFDTAVFTDRTAAILLDLATGTEQVSGSTLSGFEAVLGSAFADTIRGGDGAEFLSGWRGDDLVEGGDGNDSIAGNAGDDTLDGGDGEDIVSFHDAPSGVTVSLAAGTATGEGSDVLRNFEGVFGTAFDDSIEGDAGDNFLNGWTGGTDTIRGGEGYDTVSFADRGGAVEVDLAAGLEVRSGTVLSEIEAVVGSRFRDTILGDPGANVLQGFRGDDRIEGRSGDDTVEGGEGDDDLDGGDGFDIASFANAPTGVAADLAAGSATGDGTDTVANFEGLIGSAFDDTLIGDDGDNLLNGGTGGADVLVGGAGFDTVSFADRSGPVTVDLGAGTEAASGTTLTGFEAAVGSRSDDSLRGDAGDNLLVGLEGGDTLLGEAGSDTLAGGEGDDSLEGGLGFDVASFTDAATGVFADLALGTATGEGDDTLAGIEGLIGSDHADTLIGDAADNLLSGEAGADSLLGGGGRDTLSGGLGADVFGFAAGLADGASVVDFSGAAGEGDLLRFVGYGTLAQGATLTELGGGQWRIRSFDGSIVEEITVTGTVDPGDIVFV